MGLLSVACAKFLDQSASPPRCIHINISATLECSVKLRWFCFWIKMFWTDLVLMSCSPCILCCFLNVGLKRSVTWVRINHWIDPLYIEIGGKKLLNATHFCCHWSYCKVEMCVAWKRAHVTHLDASVWNFQIDFRDGKMPKQPLFSFFPIFLCQLILVFVHYHQ